MCAHFGTTGGGRKTIMEIRTNIRDKLLLLLLTSLCGVSLSGWGTEAYPTGAPPSACLDMIPVGHGVDGQTTTSPYSISMDMASYSPGGIVTGEYKTSTFVIYQSTSNLDVIIKL